MSSRVYRARRRERGYKGVRPYVASLAALGLERSQPRVDAPTEAANIGEVGGAALGLERSQPRVAASAEAANVGEEEGRVIRPVLGGPLAVPRQLWVDDENIEV